MHQLVIETCGNLEYLFITNKQPENQTVEDQLKMLQEELQSELPNLQELIL